MYQNSFSHSSSFFSYLLTRTQMPTHTHTHTERISHAASVPVVHLDLTPQNSDVFLWRRRHWKDGGGGCIPLTDSAQSPLLSLHPLSPSLYPSLSGLISLFLSFPLSLRSQMPLVRDRRVGGTEDSRRLVAKCQDLLEGA